MIVKKSPYELHIECNASRESRHVQCSQIAGPEYSYCGKMYLQKMQKATPVCREIIAKIHPSALKDG